MRTVGQFVRFFLVGTTGTLAYAGLYLVLRTRIVDGPALVTAWLVTTLATNLAHRYLTFGVDEPRGRAADAIVFLATSLLGLGLTTWLLSLTERDGALAHTITIVVATGVAGVLRFVLMKAWLRLREREVPHAGEAGTGVRDVPADIPHG